MKAKYDTIGIGYNQTRKADPYIVSRILHHLNPKPDGLYLDIGCGTGNYTNAFAGHGYQFTGIDPSEIMLNEAKKRNKEIMWKFGDSESTGLGDDSVHGITAVLTMHHWPDLPKAFQELHRVLKSGSNLVIFTSDPEQMRSYWLNEYFPEMMRASTEQMPAIDSVEQAMAKAGFEITDTEPYAVRPDLEDLFLQCGKYRPSRYFDGKIRNGIYLLHPGYAGRITKGTQYAQERHRQRKNRRGHCFV